jgi:hypothetical protein
MVQLTKNPFLEVWEAIKKANLDIQDSNHLAEVVRRIVVGWNSISYDELRIQLSQMWLNNIFDLLIGRVTWNLENVLSQKLSPISNAPRNTFKWITQDWNPFDFLIKVYGQWIITKTIMIRELTDLDQKLMKSMRQMFDRNNDKNIIWERILKICPELREDWATIWMIFWKAEEVRDNREKFWIS